MVGIKRKEAPSGVAKSDKIQKKQKTTDGKPAKPAKPAKTAKPTTNAKPSHLEAAANHDDDEDGEDDARAAGDGENETPVGEPRTPAPRESKPDTTSAETHAKQRALVKERKAAKPNADAIQRSKQLWERLRRKSHVPKEERKDLVAELFGLLDGKVRDFVFKHDSVRVVQCAIKYANAGQLKTIVKELKRDVRDLVESRYGKFLVAKMVMQGDREDKDLIIPEFYGQVKRLINHPEASWILDDIYRQVATPQQRSMMLREWYGPEFVLFGKQHSTSSDADAHADLAKILEESPEKRRPILQYLHQMINNLIQKKMTGFTMLHDAMLQYFLALVSGSEEQSEFLEILKGDIDAEEVGGGGDLYRNLAFTKSGSRLVCLALAYGSAKDRKVISRCFKDNIETMALDSHAKMVLVTILDVQDDTQTSNKAILRELLGASIENTTERFDRLEIFVNNLNARLPVLYPMAGAAKWLVKDTEKDLIEEVHAIRESTSKKAAATRRKELLSHVSKPLLEFVAERAANLVQSSFGCQAVTEILLECDGESRSAAKEAVAALTEGDPSEEGHLAQDAAAGRMLKSLVVGGPFDPKTKQVTVSDPSLNFAEALYPIIKSHLIEWACGKGSFVVVALLESEDVSEQIKKEVRASLSKEEQRLQTAAAASSSGREKTNGDTKKGKAGKGEVRGNPGSKLLLEKLS